jgi:DNA replication and repair protein RecF
MKINTLHLTNFRNYEKAIIHFTKNTTILVGGNAQGKTSVLEAICFLAFTKSHRTTKDVYVIKNNAPFAKIQATVDLNVDKGQFDVVISKQGKKVKFNQIEINRLSEYVGILNVVLFSPEDLDLIKGSPANRRKFLDLEITQISQKYIHHLQQYKKLLKQRNDLLKTLQRSSTSDKLLLDVITEQLIDHIKPVVKLRQLFLSELIKEATLQYQKLSSTEQKLELEYLPSISDNFKQVFYEKYEYDIASGKTNFGIHRDDFVILLNGKDIFYYGSQGEQRTAVLAIKLALVEHIKKVKGIYPILLLDDVFSELDTKRQSKLLSVINKDVQTIFTTTELKHINKNLFREVEIKTIQQGTIKESD